MAFITVFTRINMKPTIIIALIATLALGISGCDQKTILKGKKEKNNFQTMLVKCQKQHLTEASIQLEAKEFKELYDTCQAFNKTQKNLCAYGSDEEKKTRNDYESRLSPEALAGFKEICGEGLFDRKNVSDGIDNFTQSVSDGFDGMVDSISKKFSDDEEPPHQPAKIEDHSVGK